MLRLGSALAVLRKFVGKPWQLDESFHVNQMRDGQSNAYDGLAPSRFARPSYERKPMETEFIHQRLYDSAHSGRGYMETLEDLFP